MTLGAWYQEFQGVSIDIDGHPANAGQCVQAADSVLNLVYGFPYFFDPGAINWWNDTHGSLDNFDKIPAPCAIKKGDFVIYGTGVGSQYGHIDVAAADGSTQGYWGYDSNWGHNLTVHQVNHNDTYNQFILGVLRLKGETMTPDQQAIYNIGLTAVNDKWGEQITGLMAQAKANEPAIAVGTVAIRDNWQGQIQGLEAQVATLQGSETTLKPGKYIVN